MAANMLRFNMLNSGERVYVAPEHIAGIVDIDDGSLIYLVGAPTGLAVTVKGEDVEDARRLAIMAADRAAK